MVTKIQKWGNSQGLRFPRNILRQMHINVGDSVDVSIANDEIVVKPTSPARGRYKLKDLLSKFNPKHKTEEVHWGKPVGKEAW